MDWTTFKASVLDYVWRTGDTELDAKMSELVASAENRLRIDLNWHETEVAAALTVDAYPSVDLPADCDKVLALVWDDKGPAKYVTNREYYANQPAELWPAGTMPPQVTFNQREFTVIGKKIFHHWLQANDEAMNATLIYEPTFSALEGGDDSLFNEYTALYKAAVYNEVYDWMLDEQRAAYWNDKYNGYVLSAQGEQNARKYAGAPLKMQMPRRDVS